MRDDLRDGRDDERPSDWAGGGYNEPTQEELDERERAREEAERKARLEREHLAARKALREKRWSGRPVLGHGLLLGRFLPAHHGHLHLIEVARAMTPELTVLVNAQPDDPIPGALRVAWLRELAPGARVELVEGLPKGPASPNAGDVAWLDAVEEAVLKHCPHRPEALWGSGKTHELLAARLEVALQSVDSAREGVPVSGTAVRNDLRTNWRFLPAPVRAHLARRVAIVGPEGVGKTSLAKALAMTFETVLVAEAARTVAAPRGGNLEQPAFEYAVRLQRASEASLARQANRVLFCDSNALAMEHMMARLWKKAPPWVSEHAREDSYDLTIVLSGKLPFLGTQARNDEFARGLLAKKIVAALEASGAPHVVLADKDPKARQREAEAAVRAMLEAPGFLPARAR